MPLLLYPDSQPGKYSVFYTLPTFRSGADHWHNATVKCSRPHGAHYPAMDTDRPSIMWPGPSTVPDTREAITLLTEGGCHDGESSGYNATSEKRQCVCVCVEEWLPGEWLVSKTQLEDQRETARWSAFWRVEGEFLILFGMAGQKDGRINGQARNLVPNPVFFLVTRLSAGSVSMCHCDSPDQGARQKEHPGKRSIG